MELTRFGTYEMGSGVIPGLEGYQATRRNADSRHNKRVLEAARLYADALQGNLDPVFLREAMFPRHEVLVAHLASKYPGLYGDPGGRMMGLQETMAVTDYQALFVDVLDRMYYGYYNAYPIVNKQLVKIKTLRDFRIVKRYLLDGMVTPFTSTDPGAPYPHREMVGPAPQLGAVPPDKNTSTAALTYQPLLWNAGAAVNWRAFVNDDLGIFQDISSRLAIAANRGISKYITGLFLDVNGPLASLYNSSYVNLINIANGAASNNPSLSIQGLQDGLKILAGMKDSTGDPILMTGRLICWYGPEYTAVAQNLRSMLSARISVEGGTQTTATYPAQQVEVTNWIVRDMDWIMDPYIPIVASSKKLSWGLSLDPNTQNRPSVELGFLNGFETPQMFQKLPNTQRMGGGVDPTLGDFYTMDQETKIISVFAGTQIDGRSTVASNGSGA